MKDFQRVCGGLRRFCERSFLSDDHERNVDNEYRHSGNEKEPKDFLVGCCRVGWGS